MIEQKNPQNSGRAGDHNDIMDVPGIRVGNAHNEKIRTGVSVIVSEEPMVCAVDVRGGGPGTRETDLLKPSTLVDTVDAIVLAGGSTYGLAAADGVVSMMGARSRGFSLVPRSDIPVSPIVPSAILYDLANGGDKNWGEAPPYGDLGRQAFLNAENATSLELGRAGAGYGASAGLEQGGLGSVSSIEPDGLIIGALMAVNSFGSVRLPESKAFWAWPFEQNNEFGGVRPGKEYKGSTGLPNDTKLGPLGGAPQASSNRENTTIGVVAVSTPLCQADAQRVAIMAQDGLARAIRPVHAPTDGDVIFVLAPKPEHGAEALDPVTLTRIGTIAADCVARAIAKGVYDAQN